MKALNDDQGKPSYSRRSGAVVTIFVLVCYLVVIIFIGIGRMSWDSYPATYITAEGAEPVFVNAVSGVGGIMKSLVAFVGLTVLQYGAGKALEKKNGSE